MIFRKLQLLCECLIILFVLCNSFVHRLINYHINSVGRPAPRAAPRPAPVRNPPQPGNTWLLTLFFEWLRDF